MDWREWGPEAFAEARRRDVPIFLSVGYSTCYWCHVMERESFESADVAALMNERFVNVKVDREERPDVDALYMTAVQVQTRSGGWPMSCFLTPDLRYFFGGTYFPPTDAHGRPGFTTLLKAISEHWQTGRGEALATAAQMEEILRKLAVPPMPTQPLTLDKDLAIELETRSRSDFDAALGGFGNAPKFPRQTLLLASLAAETIRPDDGRRHQLKVTLDAMAAGGIRDHLGGGFHRYSTDAKWLVPHFEIMLYDQAMLAKVYAQAAEAFDDEGYAAVARGVCDFVIREMSAGGGGFIAAIDAEVDGREGLNYLWTPDQVREVLGDNADDFLNAYGLAAGFNFADPHHDGGVPRNNVLFAAGDWRAMLADEKLAKLRQKLKSARDERKQPRIDTKIITSWNGLMICGLAVAGRLLDEPRYLKAAKAAAGRFDVADLKRTDAGLDATLDDFAHLAAGLLDLYDATQDQQHHAVAKQLLAAANDRFGDAANGGHYFSSESADDVIVRQKVHSDSPLPAGAAVLADVARRLGDAETSGKTLACFAAPLHDQPGGSGAMVEALLHHATAHGPVHVEAGVQNAPPTPRQLAEAAVQIRGGWDDDRTLTLTLHIADRHHLNGPATTGELIPTTIRCDGATADLPTGDQLAGEVTATLRFEEPPASADVTVTYQACTDAACLVPVSRTIRVNGPGCGEPAHDCGQSDCACKTPTA